MQITIEDLPETDLRELIDRTMAPKGKAHRERRREFHARWLAMRERPHSLVRERIADTFHTPEIMAEVQRWATGIFNPVRRLAELGAKAYSTPPIRKIGGLGQEANEEFLRALALLRFNAKCTSWNQWQVASNTVVVLAKPCRRANGDPTLDFIKVTGACGEVYPHPDAPAGDTPAVLAYLLTSGGDVNEIEHDREEVVATVDARWWTFWNRQGQPVRSVEHGLGRFPGAVLLGAEPDGDSVDDFWNPDLGRSMVEALRESGLVGAIMGWCRKSMFGKLVALLKSADELEPDEDEEDQTMGQPETMLEVKGAELRVEDLEVKIEQFQAHMGMMLAEAARGMTGTASILDEPRPGQHRSDTADAHRHAAMRQFQQEQTVYLEPFEVDLVTVMSAMGRHIGMRGMPPPEAVAESYSATFQPLLFLDTPTERINVAIAETKFGTTDQVEYLMRHRGLSEQQARKMVMEIAERVADLNDLRAKRQSNEDPTEVQDDNTQEIRPELAGEGAAEATGRRGGRARPT